METENPKSSASAAPQGPAQFPNLLYFRGPLAIAGRITVENDTVGFTPTGWLDRVVGAAQGFDFPLDALRAMRITGTLERRLVLETDDGTYAFMGSGIEAAFVGLRAARAAELARARDDTDGAALLQRWASTLGVSPAALPAVKACVVGTFSAGPLAAQWGWLVVGGGLRFIPCGTPSAQAAPWSAAIESLSPPRREAGSVLALVDGFTFEPAEGEVDTMRLRVAWRYILNPAEAKASEGEGDATASAASPEGDPVVVPADDPGASEEPSAESLPPAEAPDVGAVAPARREFSVLFFRSVLATGGTLRFERDGLSFTPTGWLDRVAGVGRDWRVEWGAIQQVVLSGVVDKRVEVVTADRTLSLGGSDLETLFDALVFTRNRSADPALAVEGRDVVATWSKVLKLNPAEVRRPDAAAFGALRGPRRIAVWGWLVVDEHLRFLPAGKPSVDADFWSFPIEEVGAAPDGDTDALALFDGRTFEPSAGNEARRRLRNAWRMRVQTASSQGKTISERPNRRSSFRAAPPTPTTVVLRELAPSADGSRAPGLSSGGSSSRAPGLSPAASTSRTPGMPLPAASPRPPAAPAPAEDVRTPSNPPPADDARTPSNPPPPEGRSITCELRDLSFDGACLRVPEAISPGSNFALLLPPHLGALNLSVRVVYCRHVTSAMLATSYWLCGFRIESALPRDRDSLERLVMEFQRVAIRNLREDPG